MVAPPSNLGSGMRGDEIGRMKTQQHAEQRVLHLTLKHEYFAKIVEGKKPYEFRDLTDYWKSRLEGREYDAMLFRNGYHEDPQKCWSNSWDAKSGVILTRLNLEGLLS